MRYDDHESQVLHAVSLFSAAVGSEFDTATFIDGRHENGLHRLYWHPEPWLGWELEISYDVPEAAVYIHANITQEPEVLTQAWQNETVQRVCAAAAIAGIAVGYGES